MNQKPFVAIVMGSDSDLPVMQATLDTLNALEVAHEVRITSAHRTPERTHAYIHDAESRGAAVFIAAAGMAAHLAGTVAGITCKPVIGIPMESGPLKGADALYSTVQMPGGVPVACVTIGKAGAKNAALLAAQILSISDEALAGRIKADRQAQAEAVMAKDNALQEQLNR